MYIPLYIKKYENIKEKPFTYKIQYISILSLFVKG